MFKRLLLPGHPRPEPAPARLDDLRILLIDERYVRKHHGCVTLLMNGATVGLLYPAEGGRRRSLQGGFDMPSPAHRASIMAVGMDRAGPIWRWSMAQLPQPDVVLRQVPPDRQLPHGR